MEQMPRAALDPLVHGKVIGDVLDMFVPAAEISMEYGGKHIENGGEIKPNIGSERPKVRITGSQGTPNYYTLVMVDPDAPSPTEPVYREYLHWMVIDIPEGFDATEGREVMPYTGPQPPKGVHRYVIAAFRQHGPMETVKVRPVERGNFNTRKFVEENDLGLPAAALYFKSQKDEAASK